MSISLTDYFSKPFTLSQYQQATELLHNRVNPLLHEAEQAEGGYKFIQDPDTRCGISGTKGGDGDGGFRTPGSLTGAKGSAHRDAMAVDIYDPDNKLDLWLDQFEDGNGGNSMLQKYTLFREHPSRTPGWCHLQSRTPGSGHSTFMP